MMMGQAYSMHVHIARCNHHGRGNTDLTHFRGQLNVHYQYKIPTQKKVHSMPLVLDKMHCFLELNLDKFHRLGYGYVDQQGLLTPGIWDLPPRKH